LLWNQHVAATDYGNAHAFAEKARETGQDETHLALAECQAQVQQALDQIMAPPPPHVVSWGWYFAGYALLVAAPFMLMYAVYRRRRKEYSYRAPEVGTAMMFASPWLIGMIVLVAGPILFSIAFSFTRYDVLSPARYVGLDNYRRLFADKLFYVSIWDTIYMLIRVPLAMTMSLAIALLLNRSLRGIGLYRTGFYLPAVMPIVAASLLWQWVFNPNLGVLNSFLSWVFGLLHLHITPPLWLQDKNWSKPALIIMHVWSAGGAMIIWLAGLQSIPEQLYEAAGIDGAGAWRRFWNVTLPMLSPYILFNAIIGVIGTMQIFQEAFIMTHGGTPVYSTLFYAYNLFQQAFQYFRLGYAAAMAWILFVLVLALTMLQLWLSKRWVHYDRT
jgi:multiple sugar transport system permease protein